MQNFSYNEKAKVRMQKWRDRLLAEAKISEEKRRKMNEARRLSLMESLAVTMKLLKKSRKAADRQELAVLKLVNQVAALKTNGSEVRIFC